MNHPLLREVRLVTLAAAVVYLLQGDGILVDWRPGRRASDVTFGAFVGIASARTVALHVRYARFAVVPLAVPGGGGVAMTRID
jgi:hypothetical protein